MTEQTQLAPVENKPTDMVSIIGVAVANPNMTPESLKTLLEVQKDFMRTQAEVAFNQAMAQMQPHMPVIHKGSKTHNSKYAKYEAIDALVRPLYTQYGFSLSFDSRKSGGEVTYIGTLSHSAGHSRSAEMVLPADKSGSKNDIQAVGSTVSYARRYLICMLLNIVTADEDDDGHAGGSQLISDEGVEWLEDFISGHDLDRAAFLKVMGCARISDIPQRDKKKAVSTVKAMAGVTK